MSAYDDDIARSIKTYLGAGTVAVIGVTEDFGDVLHRVFPFEGSKIDWDSLPLSVERHEYDQDLQMPAWVAFFEEMRHGFKLNGSAIYLGDNLTDVALRAPIEIMAGILPILLSVPQHNYIVHEHFLWCLCFTVEGDMAFGYSARLN